MRKKTGETLVEAIVSFVIFLIILATVATIVKTSTGMNVQAREKSQAIEDAGTKIEASETDKKPTAGQLVLDFGASDSIKLDIAIKSQEPFVYFDPGKAEE